LFNLCATGCKNETLEIQSATLKTIQPKELKIVGNWKGEGEKEKLLKDIAREFEFEHQNYLVRLDFQNNFFFNEQEIEERANQVYIQIVNNSYKNDIFYLNYPIYHAVSEKMGDKLWGEKVLVNMLDYPEIVRAHKKFVFELPYIKETFGNMIPSPVIEGNFAALWYNSELARKIGIDIRQFNMTFDDFMQYVIAANQYNENHAHKINIINPKNTFPLFFSLVYSSFFGDTASSSESNFKAFKNAYESFELLSKYSAFKIHNNSGFRDEVDLMIQGNTLFTISDNKAFILVKSKNKELVTKLIPAEIPSYGDSKYYHGYFQPFWGIFKNAKNAKGAVEFMKYISSYEFAEQYEKITKSPSGLKTVLNTNELSPDKIEMFNRHIENKYGSRIRDLWGSYPPLLYNNYVYHEVKFDEIIQGTMDADEAFLKSEFK